MVISFLSQQTSSWGGPTTSVLSCRPAGPFPNVRLCHARHIEVAGAFVAANVRGRHAHSPQGLAVPLPRHSSRRPKGQTTAVRNTVTKTIVAYTNVSVRFLVLKPSVAPIPRRIIFAAKFRSMIKKGTALDLGRLLFFSCGRIWPADWLSSISP